MTKREYLGMANEIRTRRSHLKTHLRSGTTKLSLVLYADKSYTQTMAVWDLLLAVPAVGEKKAQEVIDALGIGPSTPLEALSIPRRIAMLDWMKERYPKVVL